MVAIDRKTIKTAPIDKQLIAPALKDALAELKRRAHAQGVEGKRYTKEFMEEQKPLIDYVRLLHKQYQSAVEKKLSQPQARWDEKTLSMKERAAGKIVAYAEPKHLAKFRAETLGPALKRAQEELKRRAHAQGVEGNRYTGAFLAEQKPLVDHVLALHALYKKAGQRIAENKPHLELVVNNQSKPAVTLPSPSFARTGAKRVAALAAAFVLAALGVGDKAPLEPVPVAQAETRADVPKQQNWFGRLSLRGWFGQAAENASPAKTGVEGQKISAASPATREMF